MLRMTSATHDGARRSRTNFSFSVSSRRIKASLRKNPTHERLLALGLPGFDARRSVQAGGLQFNGSVRSCDACGTSRSTSKAGAAIPTAGPRVSLVTTLLIPANLKVRKQSFLPSNQSVSGGLSATGFEQVLAGPGGRWKASLSFHVDKRPEQLAYRGFLVACQGRGVEVLVGPRDGIRPLDASGHSLNSRGVVLWDNGALFGTGGGWSTPIVATGTVAAAAAQTTTLTLFPIGNQGVEFGSFIGIVDRIYMAIGVATDAASGVQTVSIWPWLRAAVGDGQTVTLDKPLCRMRLATDDSGALEKSWKEVATPTIDFVESFDP